MKIQKGDKVKIMKGKDRGKSGKVIQIFPKEHRVIVEGLNLLTKNLKSRKDGSKGERIKFNAPMHLSNVMLVCPKCSKSTRVGRRSTSEGQKKERYCHRCEQTI